MNAAKVIPFQFEARKVRALLIDDQPWFFAIDVCSALALSDTNKALLGLDSDEKCEHEQYSGSGRKPILINESGLYSLILRSRKAEAKRFKKWVTAEVLPSIRKHGRYEDTDNRMATLVGQTIGTDGFHMLGSLIKGKVSSLPQDVRRRATMKIWSQTHAAFGVRSAADIPAEQLDSARNFIAAYALEGEWLPKDEIKGFGTLIGRPLGRIERWMVSTDYKGEEQYTLIPTDACVMSHHDLIKAMLTPGDLPVSTDEMFEFAQAALTNLKTRATVQQHQLRQMRQGAKQ
ncbi:BRO family protein [Pseudomonas entomophila]|uniref:BRO-N domain-containing protein n=1 Tax=Pseudomonas entomophila TaxID=312306 RepID=UPI0023D7BA10|nr:BRO family protein [Pseudomonas entomophila]MDF0729119.1 BRO family protein [Pseudomonas entomophila]MDF0729239.1 BRO family protein [Pseudomonas entomophila]MDF0731048.1 BRO family protein [Pseudomonas entomophila]MDF0733574.1 BRO family protein [Pseudomonas entomophila]